MLRVLRHKKTAKKIWIGLALIIIPAFTLLGFGGTSCNREASRPLGRIFGRPVSNTEFRDAISAVTTSAIMQYGDQFREIEKELNLEAQAWERLILLYEAKRRGIKTSDQEIIQTIRSLPYFQYKGAFDNRIYNQTLQYVFRLKAREFEEQMRANLILHKLYKQVTDPLNLDDKGKEEKFRDFVIELNKKAQ
jgi:hypothetical protein